MPVINMAFDVSGLRSGVDRARAMIEQLTTRVQALEDRYARVGWEATASGQAQSKAFRGIASQVHKLAAEVAGLYSAFKAFDAMKGFVQRGIEVNETLESAQLSIASIISATNKISDSQGNVLKGAEKFAAAEQISAKMLKEMQVLALETTASFADIADGVAGIIAPATKAGIALEKLPKFAITAVQAMTTMGLHTNQMRTEIEAILSGNISKSQDLLATNLGITKEMVQEWQKAGTLQENLMKRMEAFNIAGIKAQSTWRGLKGNMGDALDYLASFASKGLFDSLKTAWSELIDFMVNTDASKGEIGLSKNIDGLMGLIKDLEDEVGKYLVDAVRDLMDEIGDLNDPNNIQAIKDAFASFKGQCGEVIDSVVELKNAVVSLASTAKAVFSWLPNVIADARRMAEGGVALARGEITAGEFFNSAEVTQAALDRARRRKTVPTTSASALAGAGLGAGRVGARAFTPPREGEAGFVGPSKPTGRFKTTSDIGGYGGGGSKKKKGGGGKSDAQKLAENAERYSLSLEKMRNEVTALENAMNPALTTYDRTVAKINAEKEAAIKNADVKARETVLRHQATQAQAEEMAGLEKRKAELTAQQKLDELSLKTLRDKANFYKEFAELTGRTGESLALQNQLIDQQAKEWAALGVPMDDVKERVRLMKMEISDNPIDGLVLGLHKYASEAGNLAQTMSGAVTQAFSSMEDAFVQFAMTGKLEFKDMANSIIADLMRITMRSMILGPIASAISSGIGSLFTGMSNLASGGTWDFGVASGSFTPTFNATGMKFAYGGAFSSISGYRNAIVSSPTVFSYGSRLTRFARGGVMGEAGPEAVMPLTRMGNGNLGVQAAGGGVMELSLTIVDRTQGGVGVEDAQASQGGLKLDVIVQQIDSKLAGLAASGKSKLVGAMEKTHRMPSTRGWN